MDGFPTDRLGSWPGTLVEGLTSSIQLYLIYPQLAAEELFSEWLMFPDWSQPCFVQLKVSGGGTSGGKFDVPGNFTCG